MVLPHIEYCCPLWSPTTIGKIRKLESVQRSFTAKIHTISNLSYWERLKRLEMYSVERRRERYLMIYVYKIIQGITPNFEGEKFMLQVETNARRGRFCIVPSLNTRAPARVTTMVEASLSVTGPKLFNSLPMDIRNCNVSVDAFKARLDKFLKRVPDQPCLPGYQQPALSNSILGQLAALRAAGIYLD